VAASRGHLHILKYLHEKRYAWNSQTTGLAAQGDHYDCLKYAIDNEARKLGLKSAHENGEPVGEANAPLNYFTWRS
jgi:hypothetical protein